MITFVRLALKEKRNGWGVLARVLKRGCPAEGEVVIQLKLDLPNNFFDHVQRIEIKIEPDMVKVEKQE